MMEIVLAIRPTTSIPDMVYWCVFDLVVVMGRFVLTVIKLLPLDRWENFEIDSPELEIECPRRYGDEPRWRVGHRRYITATS